MGFDLNAARLFSKMKRDGARFGRVLTLGHQHNHLSPVDYRRFCEAVGAKPSNNLPEYADSLFSNLGAEVVDALDASDYEGAAIMHDLNVGLPSDLKEQYDLVFDGGTLEHVFNFPIALKSCMEMISGGGAFVSITMANNYCGHGFYQFSPELFWRVLCEENGFEVVEMYLCPLGGSVYQVADPDTVRQRVELRNHEPVSLLIHARRVRVVPLLVSLPQQSDYAWTWRSAQSSEGGPTERQRPWWFDLRGVKFLRDLRGEAIVAAKKRRIRRGGTFSNRKIYTRVDLGL